VGEIAEPISGILDKTTLAQVRPQLGTAFRLFCGSERRLVVIVVTKNRQEQFEIDWIQRDRKVIDGLDHLGIELISINLYQAMLPGMTNATNRARYYSFYPWILHRYAQEGPEKRTKAAWRNWFRALEFSYAVACIAYEQELKADFGSAVVGADAAVMSITGKSPNAKIDIVGPCHVETSGAVPKKGTYFKNPEGGFGQYYKGALRELGMIVEHKSDAWPDVQLTNFAGKRIAQTIDHNKGFGDLKELAGQGNGRLKDFVEIGRAVHPTSIEANSEEGKLLRSLLFGSKEEFCVGQDFAQKNWRRESLLLALHFAREAGSAQSELAHDFRWACAYRLLPDGRQWKIPAKLMNAVRGWAAYQRNDLLNYCLECIFYAALLELDRGPCPLSELVSNLVELGMGPVVSEGGHPRLGSVPKIVAAWIRSMQEFEVVPGAEHWGSFTTWSLADRLAASVASKKAEHILPVAVRLLGRLATDRGEVKGHPFSPIPECVEMAAGNEVHLDSWWKRIAVHSSQSTVEFLKELLLEWILYRHLRVATRKLANQGVSTFKFRPEEGHLFLVAENLPKPTYTSPRVRQAFRIVQDLHCIHDKKGAVQLSSIGKLILEGQDA